MRAATATLRIAIKERAVRAIFRQRFHAVFTVIIKICRYGSPGLAKPHRSAYSSPAASARTYAPAVCLRAKPATETAAEPHTVQ
jgi:hypothetical protein